MIQPLDDPHAEVRQDDNPIPVWWSGLFILTVAFAPLYIVFYHVGTMSNSIQAAYEIAVTENLRLQFAEIGELQGDQATLLKYKDDAKWLAVGRSVFQGNCVSCHGNLAQGSIGPNLTDDYWKNVRTLEDIAKVVAKGAASGAMPAWQNRLHPNERVLVSAYVASLRGQNVPGPRGQEGQLIEPWTSEVNPSP